MFEWEEADRYSFEDSDRFEEDSICSWISEPESVVNNWRGWRKNLSASNPVSLVAFQTGAAPAIFAKRQQSEDRGVLSLTELSAREVAASIPFELVEHYFPPVPEELQLRIAFWSFPEQEEDIRLYSCLANGSADEFVKGEHMLKIKAVKDPLQIGFHLSATVAPGSDKQSQSTSVTFDRRKIVSCQCSCNSTADWCSHVVALCLHRIHHPHSVKLRAPVSESLSRLERDQLQKFAQYLIAELPQQILPTAQRLLDELLSPGPSEIKSVSGAPDPTAGGAASEQTSWCLDAKNLKDNIKKILIKFCVPAPIVFSDVNYLSTTAPPSAAEWCSFLRPLRGREPEGMWNLLSIVREMFRRNDRNSIPLLEIITQQCLETAQIMVWWFNTKVALHHRGSTGKQVNSNSQASQNACASLCDEIVTLWKLAALNPCISPKERHLLKQRLMGYHVAVIEKIQANQSSGNSSTVNGARSNGGRNGKPSDLEVFSGFKSAIEACTLDWSNDPIDGITYGHNSHYLCPFAIFKLKEGCEQSQVNSSQAVLRCEYPGRPRSVDFGNNGGNVNVNNVAKPASAAREPVSRQDSGNVDGAIDGASAVQQPNSFSSSEEGVSDEGVGDESLQPMLSNQFESGNEDEDDDDNGHPVQQDFNQLGNEKDEGQPDGADANQYQVYFYDSKDMASNSVQGPNASGSSPVTRVDIFRKLRSRIDDDFEMKLMRAEGVYAHGFFAAACDLAVDLANKMLQNPPNLLPTVEPVPTASVKSKRKKSSVSAASHALTHKTSTTLSHCAFLCTVLTENPAHHHLAFQIGMFGLELARPPASTKPMEVKLAHQESELVSLLKRIPLGPQELSILRDRGVQLREGTLRSRGEALLPLLLTTYIFESLVSAQTGVNRRPGDEVLGFEAAVAAIGLKAHVSEADHPLLCEGTRRQRGDLALLLLVHYKDQPERLAKIMDRLLDKEIHQLFRSPVSPSYYVANPGRSNNMNSNLNQPEQPHAMGDLEHHLMGMGLGGAALAGGAVVGARRNPDIPPVQLQPNLAGFAAWREWENGRQRVEEQLQAPNQPPLLDGNARAPRSGSQEAAENAAFWQRNAETPSSEHSVPLAQEAGMELSRSRHFPLHRAGPGSDSGSSGNSSADSMDSSSSSNRPIAAAGAASHNSAPKLGLDAGVDVLGAAAQPGGQQLPHLNFPPVATSTAGAAAAANLSGVVTSTPPATMQTQVPPSLNEMTNMIRSTLPSIKGTRFKGKRTYPSLPNQPSEASAHFMFELAKQVLTKAGGNSSTSLFTQPTANQNPRGPHRALHMCAFQIGLYALGLHNRVSPNWLSRTYSSHVSWITGQAMEIGASAISFLVATWEGHLTPPEAASMADKASKSREETMVVAASELALSVLPHAAALNPNEIQRAIQQCKEQSHTVLEKACLAVEKAATGGGVYPEVMFEVARHWYHLFEKHAPSAAGEAGEDEAGLQHDHLMRGAGAQGSNAAIAVAAAAALGLGQTAGHNFQAPPPPIQLPFPVYGLIPGFPHGQAGSAAASAHHQIPLQMYAVAPPPTAAAAAAALHLQGLAAAAVANGNGSGLQMFPPTSNSNHFNLAGGSLYQFGATGIQLAPLLPNPPATQAQLQAAAAVQQAHAAAAANHNAAAMTAAIFGAGVHQHPMAAFHAGGPVLHHPQQHPHQVPLPHHHNGAANVPPPPSHGHHGQHQHHQQQPARLQAAAQRYLVSAYRVGMLALENLGRRISEDRPQMKFARNPSYGDDVKWLLNISKKLGPHHIQSFLGNVWKTVVSPFLLQDLAYDCARYLAVSQSFPPVANPSYNSIIHQIRSQPKLSQLVTRCYETYFQCIHQRLYHLTPNDYEDFVSVLVHAKRAFNWLIEGPTAFQQLLSSIKRSKSCKKELWSKIVSSNNSQNSLDQH